MFPTLPISTPTSPRALLLTRHQSSLFLHKSTYSNLLLQISSFTIFSQEHSLQSLTPQTMLPTYLLSAKIKLLQPWSPPLNTLGVPPPPQAQQHNMAVEASSTPRRLWYLSHQHSLFQLAAVSAILLLAIWASTATKVPPPRPLLISVPCL